MDRKGCMRDMKQKDIWKPISIILALLILLSIVGVVILLIFGGNKGSSSAIENMKAAELTEINPSKEEMEIASSITISTQSIATDSKKEEKEVQQKSEEEKEAKVKEELKTSATSHRYEVINTRMTWSEAKAYCENLGGYLATVESQEEYNKIIDLANASGRKVLWLGAQKNVNQSFEWITGEDFNYSFWLSGEPNNEGGNENCLVMFYVNNQWVWADVPNDVSPYYGDETVGFVCEYDEE